jgi:hypothetical protein
VDWPTTLLPPLPILSVFQQEFLSEQQGMTTNAPASQSGGVNNQAWFIPFRIDVERIAVKLCYVVGATASGDVDMGIYDSQWNRLVSNGAGTAQGSINTLQEFNITDTPLPPGQYALALSLSLSTGTFFAASVSDESTVPLIPMYEQATAHPLPNPATPVQTTSINPRFNIAMAVSFDTLI